MSAGAFYQWMTRCETFVLLWISLVLGEAVFGMDYVTVVLTSLEYRGVLTGLLLLSLILTHGCGTEGYWAN